MIKSLQSLRFLFALMIFLHHSALNWGALGAFPVSFFLILSGFVLMKGYGSRINDFSYFAFLKKRIQKIYPTHVLCLLIALLVSLIIVRPVNLLNTVPSFFMLQAWIPSKEVYFAGNSVSWYVSVIVFCYALFPLLVKCIKKYPTITMAVSVGLYIIAGFIVPEKLEHAVLYINPLFRIVDFILGMWLFEALESDRFSEVARKVSNLKTGSKFLLESIVFAISLLFIVVSLKIESQFTYAAFWWIPSLLIIYTFYTLDASPGPLTRVLHSKWLVTLGSISYAFYLLHISVLTLNDHLMDHHPINYLLDGIIVLTITVILAYIITNYFEPLFTKKKSNEK